MQTKDGRRVSILKERSMAIIQSEQRGGKKEKERNLNSHVWYNTKSLNLRVIGIIRVL